MGRLTRAVTLLGSTGSIGTQALDVIARSPEAFRVHALAAHSDVDALIEQVRVFRPARVALADPAAARRLREATGMDVETGPEAATALAGDADADVVLNAVVGAAGLAATLAALDAGRHVALANKESCVAGGPLVAARLRAGAHMVPVDSEHASIHMCLRGEEPASVSTVVLTASGGPFRSKSAAELEQVTPEQALRHPTWEMGARITVDSATLMNKGLEVLEAHVLFDLDFDAIEVVCHPQSVVHCIVGFADGSWKSALGPPDMRVPIAYALGHPDRPSWGAERVGWSQMQALTFEPVDAETFRCLPLAYRAGRTGGTAPAVLNAADEVAVQAFLDGALSFPGIADLVERVLDEGESASLGYGRDDLELEDVLRADGWAREHARGLIAG